jgi:beta-fructofuranosidase
MNDPNGTLFHEGTDHLFYQHNPYRPRWGRIHWGHARSRDLVHWEHLPIALAPDGGVVERHCFSGCCAIAADGTPTILYTRVGMASLLSMARRWADQCAAFGDAELVAWSKHPGNPVLRESAHRCDRIQHWRDPYVFRQGGDWYLVLAGLEPGEPSGSVLLYRSATLLDWEYRGRLASGDPSLDRGIECPNYFELGDRWVLLVSPYGPVRYRVGEFRNERHIGGTWRSFDHGRAFYATQTFADDRGRTIVVGWIRGPRGDGWAGCLSLPREVRLGPEDALSIEPVRELESLRRHHRRIEVSVGPDVGSAVEGATFPERAVEFRAHYEVSNADACGFEIRSGAGRHRLAIDFRRGVIASGTEEAILSFPIDPRGFELRAFLDASVLEVFAGGREAFTTVVPFASDHAGPIEIVPFASGGTGRVRADFWRLASIGIDGTGRASGIAAPKHAAS